MLDARSAARCLCSSSSDSAADQAASTNSLTISLAPSPPVFAVEWTRSAASPWLIMLEEALFPSAIRLLREEPHLQACWKNAPFDL